MQKAYVLAQKAKGLTSPNPTVGAVLVKNGTIIGEGFHQGAGKDHAEIEALKNVHESLEGAVLYSTLEPCSIQGRTPPCIHAIRESGIKEVIIGSPDFNPKINGQGIAFLQNHGITVTQDVLKEQCVQLNEDFFTYITQARPFVNLKVAATLDGKIADENKHSKWITNEKARNHVHKLRKEADAVITGIGTILADDPKLNIRNQTGALNKKYRIVVLDSSLRIPLTASIFTYNSPSSICIFTTNKKDSDKEEKLKAKGVEVISFGDELNLRKVLYTLGTMSVMNVLVEGGQTITSAFLREKFVDKAYLFYGNKILGGQTSLSFAEHLGIKTLDDSLTLDKIAIQQFDDTILIEGYLKNVYRTH